MKKQLVLLLAATTTCFSLPSLAYLQTTNLCGQIASLNAGSGLFAEDTSGSYGVICEPQSPFLQATIMDEFVSILNEQYALPRSMTLSEINAMLHKEAGTLNTAMINKVLTTLKCANQYNINHNNMLTIIDYSLPSSEKRLWVFDLTERKLLFNTYVSHGIKSGVSSTNYFSNKFNSKASSMGVYKTEKVYYGRHGISLKLDGLERGFNDNASNRSVVMHGGWYVDERFIKKYGRAGRSWGCPAVPDNLTESIINTIKDNSLFVVYYPSDDWFLKSKFLRCDQVTQAQHIAQQQMTIKALLPDNELRADIIFADLHNNNRLDENDPLIVITADRYNRIFHTIAPLERMLRRQINDSEYVALSTTELKQMITPSDITLSKNNQNDLDAINFVIPVIKMVRGYYETQM